MLAKLNTQVIIKSDVEDNDQIQSNRYHEDAGDKGAGEIEFIPHPVSSAKEKQTRN